MSNTEQYLRNRYDYLDEVCSEEHFEIELLEKNLAIRAMRLYRELTDTEKKVQHYVEKEWFILIVLEMLEGC